MNPTLKKILRIIGYTAGGLVFLFMLVVFALRFSFVQRQLIPPAENIISDALDTEVKVGGLFLEFPMKASLDRVVVFDQRNEPLAKVGAVQVSLMSVPVWRLVFGDREDAKKIGVSRIDVVEPEVRLYTRRKDSVMNIDFLLAPSEDTVPKSPRVLLFEFPRVNITGGSFTFIDSTKSDSILKISDTLNTAHFRVKDLNTRLSLRTDSHQNIRAELFHLEAKDHQSGIVVDTLKGDFWIWSGVYHAHEDTNRPFIMTRDLILRSGQTRLDLDALLYDEDFKHLTDTLLDDPVAVRIRPSTFDFYALKHIVGDSFPLAGRVGIEGILKGSLETLESPELKITFMDTTRLTAELEISNFLKTELLSINMLFKDSSRVSFVELDKMYANGEIPLKGTAYLEGRLRGSLNHLRGVGLQVHTGDFTRLDLDFSLYNLADTSSPLFARVSFDSSKVSMKEVLEIAPMIELPDQVKNLKNLRFGLDGQVVGGLDKFVVKANVLSDYGNVYSNVDLTLPTSKKITSGKKVWTQTTPWIYDGWIRTQHLDYNLLTLDSMKLSSDLNMDLEISGRGIEPATMNSRVSGKIVDSDLMGYLMDSISIAELRIAEDTLSGEIALFDRQGNVKLTPKVFLGDKEKGPRYYSLEGEVDCLNVGYYLAGFSTPDTVNALDTVVVIQTVPDTEGGFDWLSITDLKSGKLPEERFRQDTVYQLKRVRKVIPVDTLPILLATELEVKVKGDSLEWFSGFAFLKDIKLENYREGKSLYLENINLYSPENSPDHKYVNLISSLASGEIDGNFLFGSVDSLVARVDSEATLFIKNVDSLTHEYYSNKKLDTAETEISLFLKTEPQFNDFLAFFKVPAYVSNSTWLDLDFFSREYDKLEVSLSSDSIDYYGKHAKQNTFSGQLVKDGAENNVLIGFGDLRSDQVFIDSALTFNQFNFETLANNRNLEYWLTGLQEGFENEVCLNAVMEIYPNVIEVNLVHQSSSIELNGERWEVAPDNGIYIEPSWISFENVELHNGTQRIYVEGDIIKNPEKYLRVGVVNVDLLSFSELYSDSTKVRGVVDSINVKLFDLLDKPHAKMDGRISGLGYATIDSVLVLLEGDYESNEDSNLAHVGAHFRYRNEEILTLLGNYDLDDTLSPLFLTSKASNLPVKFAEPFVEEYVEVKSGKVRIDTLEVKGSLNALDINGIGHFEETMFHVKYLNNDIRLSNATQIKFNKDYIRFPEITLLDPEGNKAILDGRIYHESLDSFSFDLQVNEIRNFLFMNTTRKDNDFLFGKVIVAEGFASISGDLEMIEVTANVAAGKGSSLAILLEDYETADRPDYVEFVGKSGAEDKKKENSSGYKLTLRVDADENTEARLIFDEKVGDEIKVTGILGVNIELNDKGEMVMDGTYENLKGSYLFTTYNVYNKKLYVDDGTITFNGDDLYKAELNLTAKTQKIEARLGDLLGNDNNTTVPVTIYLDMSGPLEQPIIKLRPDVSSESEGAALIKDYLASIQNDEQELNRQVVSLLIFKRFAPSHSGGGGTTGFVSAGLTSTVSDLISNQVNNWLSQAFDDQFGVELSANSANEVDLALKASLFGDKVTIERNGTLIGDKQGQVSIGDISVLIKLLPRQVSKKDTNYVADPSKGQLVVEIFNRENANITSTRNSFTTGSGLFYKKDFDRLTDLLRKEVKEKK